MSVFSMVLAATTLLALPLAAQTVRGDGPPPFASLASGWNDSSTMAFFLAALRARETSARPGVFDQGPVIAIPAPGKEQVRPTPVGEAPFPDVVLPTTTVPEPATMVLLASGLLALGAIPFFRRIRARQ